MDKRVLSILEYDKILEKLQQKASCCLGRDAVKKLHPLTDPGHIRAELSLTAEAEAYLFRTGASPIRDFNDVRPTLKRSKAALALSMKELLDIAGCLRALRHAKEKLCQEQMQGTNLYRLADQLVPCRSVEEEITRCILSEEEMADAASIELARIRQQLRRVQERVREKLNTMIRSHAKYLQEPIITVRSGRYVLPVKQEARQFVPGIVHDQSGSGATLFIEPSAVVELGNEARTLTGLEQEEIERILSELTALISPHAQDVIDSLETLGDIDLIFAKAELAKSMKAVMPELNRKGIISIKAGRHPLIDPDKVVPIDIWLGDSFHSLIITGPNTGGKTVTLKTVGLFTLMAQSGMFVPAHVGTRLCVFDNVYADIGDEQSIEQSLSTFSSHMKNIVSILETADDSSLVLLDELGAGTDPVEGAALAMSILEELHSRGCTTLATTHYSEIKAFAMTKEGMENACMEFDIDKLAPTYRIFVGIPGRSNAFEISSRLGVADHIIENAKSFLKGEDVRFEDVISSAQDQKAQAEEEYEKAKILRQELEKELQKTKNEVERLRAVQEKYKQQAKDEAKELLERTRREMDDIIKKLRNSGASASNVERSIQQARDAMRENERKLYDKTQAKQTVSKSNTKADQLKVGDTVNILSLNTKAVVLSLPDAKGEVMVQAGAMKMSLPLHDLEKTRQKQQQSNVKRGLNKDVSVPLSLDLRGMLVQDALLEVDRYIDNAILTGREEISIIHGKGTGALRAGIHDHLKHHSSVKSFRLGAYGEGDAGVTVVTLKR